MSSSEKRKWCNTNTNEDATGAGGPMQVEMDLNGTHLHTSPLQQIGPSCSKKKKITSGKQKLFNFEKYAKRRIALLYCYLGWDYGGLQVQASTSNTVEEQLYRALETSRLIEDRETAGLSSCGRTDKGVSAFKQVASVIVRSNLVDAPGVFWPIDELKPKPIDVASQPKRSECPYVQMLNGVLPTDIRVLAWSPVPMDFNARHECRGRTYKYWLPEGQLDVDEMRVAGQLLVGEHDFRNFCVMDGNNTRPERSFVRSISVVNIQRLSSLSDGCSTSAKDQSATVACSKDGTDFLELTVSGSGFLLHQIRMIVAVLLEIGKGNERFELVADLLDVEKTPRRPNYAPCSETPLCLFDTSYVGCSGLQWDYDPVLMFKTVGQLEKVWAEMQTRAHMLRRMLDGLGEFDCDAAEAERCRTRGDCRDAAQVRKPVGSGSFGPPMKAPCHPPSNRVHDYLYPFPVPTAAKHTKFMDRQKLPTLEEKRAACAVKMERKAKREQAMNKDIIDNNGGDDGE